MDWEALFHQMHPGFFEREDIRCLEDEDVLEEQALSLSEFDPTAFSIPVPEGISFGFFQGNAEELMAAVRAVDEDWVQYFGRQDRVFCAFHEGKPVSFCIVESMGEYMAEDRKIRIAGPGCVGTVPAFRRQGIGLKMVQLATQVLKEEGYDYSYIHFTAVGHWYARLGYKTILTWNAKGIL